MNKAALIINGHRLFLTRVWNESKPLVLYIGLNPSTANSSKDDPTVKKLIKLTDFNGYGGFHLLNLFTLITSKPKVLKETFESKGLSEIIHYSAHTFFKDYYDQVECVIAMWGNLVPKQIQFRPEEIKQQFPNLLCFDINKNGSPQHPLFINSKTPYKKYT